MAVAAMLVAPAAARQPFRTNGARPNIIHVLADDLGHNDIGFMNGNITHTPNLNRFRQHAIMLTSHYVFKVGGWCGCRTCMMKKDWSVAKGRV